MDLHASKKKKTRKVTKYSTSKFIVQSNPVNTQTEGVLESVRIKEGHIKRVEFREM